MSQNKMFRSRVFALDPRMGYLPEQDRYLIGSASPKYKFNVIGVGINGQEHVAVTMLEGQALIHGVYDPNPLSVAAAQKIFQRFVPQGELVVYDSLEAACHDPEVDGLIICTPNYTHLAVVKVAAASGKHILLEKPIATTVQDAYAITQIAENYEAVFQIGLQYRYKAVYHEAVYEVLKRKTIGEIKTISMLEHRVPFLDKVNQWNKFSKFSGDTLVEKCCHYFDLLNLFAQARPVSVYASGSQDVNFTEFEYGGEKSDILDNALVIVNYANGVRARFDLCMFAPLFYEELILCGDDGRLKAWEEEDFLANEEGGTFMEIMCADNRPSRKMRPSYPAAIQSSGHNGATYYEHVNFIEQIEGRASDAATAAEGLWSIVVAAAAQESIKRGTVVEIDAFLADCGVDL